MSSPKFAETHNVVVFLEKTEESNRFAEIIDFLKESFVHYALIVNPVIYTSCIEQFWATAKVQTVNGVRQLQALVDKKRVIVTESSIRRDLHLDDAEGTDCLPTATIFKELARIGYEKPSQKLTFYKAFFSPEWKYYIHTITQSLSAKSTAWNEFSSSMASLIICLATNQKFNLSKVICQYKRFLVNSIHTKKAFANMKRAGKDFSRRITPLFDTMMVQPIKEMGEDLDHPTDSLTIPIIDQSSSTSQPRRNNPSQEASKTGGRGDDALKKGFRVERRRNNGKTYGLRRLRKVAVTTANVEGSVVPTTIEEITLAQTLIQIKAAKPKVVTTAATTTTTTRPKDRGVLYRSQFPLKRKDQIALDEQIARDIQAKLDAELLEEQKLARKQEEETPIKGNKEELTDEEKAKLFMELMEKRRKNFRKAKKRKEKVERRRQLKGQQKKMDAWIGRKSIRERKQQNPQRNRNKDLEALWRIVKAKYGDTRPENEFERVLWGDLKVMLEPDIKIDIWIMLQGYMVTVWKLIDSSGVYFLRFDNIHIFMLVERRYPLTPITITNMLNKKTSMIIKNEMCYQLLMLMVKQQKGNNERFDMHLPNDDERLLKKIT
ncbi:hypothetical protein Tco_0670325 [Tanacetum coccineum]